MYLEALSNSLNRLCEEQCLSWKAASQRCQCSSSYFRNIISQKSVPTIVILERICHGFEKTPNDLLSISAFDEEFSYRVPMSVQAIRVFPNLSSPTSYPVCPRCKCTMEWEYQSYCDRCGQCLSWNDYHKAEIISK